MTTTTTRTSTAAEGATSEEHPMSQVGREAAQDAGRLAERAADIGLARADEGRQQVASTVDRLASSIRRVSSDLEAEEPGVSDVVTTAAEQAERLGRYLRETDARQLLRSVEDMARRQPILFVGGAFLIGLAASRFVKAADGGTPSSMGTSFRPDDDRRGYAIGSATGAWTGSPHLDDTAVATRAPSSTAFGGGMSTEGDS